MPTRQVSRRRRTGAASAVRLTLLIVGALVMIYPLLWLISGSVKPENQIFSNPGLWPETFRFQNYIDGWVSGPVPFGVYILNSLIVAGASVVGNLVSCSMAAYAFARLNFKSKRLLFGALLGTVLLPFHVTLVPQYVLFWQLGWVNSFLPLIVPKFLAVDAFFVFLMVQFIRTIPRELDDAARIDGAGAFGVFRFVIFPLMQPVLVTTAIFTFIWTWNDFFTHLLYLGSPNIQTVSVGLRQFQDSQGMSTFGPLFAMTVVSLIPVFVIFLILNRRVVDGVATSGLKG